MARRASTMMNALLVLAMAVALTLAALAAPRDVVPASRGGGIDLRAQQLPSAQLTAFTLNVRFDMNAAQAEADMVRAFTLGEVGGFQEFSELEDRATLMRLASERDWGWYMPVGGGEAIPIVWNRARFRLISGQTILVHGPELNVTPSRYINIVKLRELATGKVFGVINTHTISNASFDARLTDMHRIPRLRLHLQLLRQAILDTFATTEHVIAMGDLNVNYLADRVRQNKGLPTDALGDVVSFDMPLTGSRGQTSLLDYGMSVKENGGFRLLSSRIEYGFNSDHDAVVLTYGTNDLFRTGPVFNRPTGTANEKREITARAVRAIGDAEAGATIRVAVQRLDDAAIANALVAAALRGVAVQIVRGPGALGAAEQALVTAVGTDQTQPSWFKQCAGSCLGGSGRLETNVVLVSRAGGASEVSYVLGGAPEQGSRKAWSDAFLTTDSAVYAGYDQTFEQLSLDSVDTRATRTARWGAYTALLFPAAEGKDPVEKTLKSVKCKSRAKVRLTVGTWNGKRGATLAERLLTMREQGCDVRAVLGRDVARGVSKKLTKAGVPVVHRRVGQNVLVVKGGYRKQTGTFAWVGGPGWGTRSLGSDGVTLGMSGPSAKRYLNGFYRVWKKK